MRWIDVHDLYTYIGPEKTKGIRFFHAFTGCETASAFRNKSKKTAWQTWEICPEASPIFSKLSRYPPILNDGDLEIFEKFVILMYDRASTAVGVDEARLDLFAQNHETI